MQELDLLHQKKKAWIDNPTEEHLHHAPTIGSRQEELKAVVQQKRYA